VSPEAFEIAAKICEDVLAQSRNPLFRSAARICAAKIREAARDHRSVERLPPATGRIPTND
jgi:hypothetical protein